MRITYLHQYFNTPRMPGGTRSYELARRFVAAGHEVDMVTTRRDGDGSSRGWSVEECDGIRVHWLDVPYANAMSYPQRLRAFARFARESAMRAATLPADVVFATSTPLTIAIPGAYAAWRRGVPMVFEVRDLWPDVPIAIGAIRGSAARRAARALERFAYARAAHIIALSPGMAAGVMRAGVDQGRVSVAPNACDTGLFDVPEAAGVRFRSRHPLVGERKIVLYAGTFGKINNSGYLVDLALALREIDPGSCVVAIGTGGECEHVRRRAAACGVLGDNFLMLGSMPKQDVVEAFSASAITLSLCIDLPETRTNSANKFFDSLAAARPVAVNYGGWQAELIERHALGLVLPPDDARVAAAHLSRFLRSPERQAMARAAARGLAHGEFSREKVAGDVLARLEEVVAVAAIEARARAAGEPSPIDRRPMRQVSRA